MLCVEGARRGKESFEKYFTLLSLVATVYILCTGFVLSSQYPYNLCYSYHNYSSRFHFPLLLLLPLPPLPACSVRNLTRGYNFDALYCIHHPDRHGEDIRRLVCVCVRVLVRVCLCVRVGVCL